MDFLDTVKRSISETFQELFKEMATTTSPSAKIPLSYVFVPVHYGDVVKPLNDLLTKDYPVGATKLELNTTAPNGVDNKSSVIASELKAKYAVKAHGFTMTETWNTANVLSTQVELEDTFVRGLKLDLNAHLHPSVGKKNAKAGFEYKQANVFTRANVDLFKGPTINTDAVVGTESVVIGADVSYDVTDAKVSKFNAVIAHSTRDYTMAAQASNMFGHYAFSYFHKVAAGVDAGARCQWNQATDSSVSLEVGTKYALDPASFVKAKINNTGILGLGYTQILRPGVKLSLGGQFDTSRLNEAAHKVGMSLVFDA